MSSAVAGGAGVEHGVEIGGEATFLRLGGINLRRIWTRRVASRAGGGKLLV